MRPHAKGSQSRVFHAILGAHQEAVPEGDDQPLAADETGRQPDLPERRAQDRQVDPAFLEREFLARRQQVRLEPELQPGQLPGGDGG